MIKELEEERELFAAWRESLQKLGIINFYEDGIVNFAQYCNSTPRILFVLKEVNSGEKEEDAPTWNFKDFLHKGGRPQTWDNISRWVTAILIHSQKTVAWQALEKIEQAKRKEMLAKIAVMNLKKSSGGHTALNKRVALACVRDVEFLKRQFNIYKPDITVCGGVCGLFLSHVIGQDNFTRHETIVGIPFYKLNGGQVIIDYHHPEARCRDNVLFYTFKLAIDEILANKNQNI